MALDGVLLSGVARELSQRIIHGRVERVLQPEADEVHLLIRNEGTNLRLLLSASASHPRVHLTAVTKPNPLSPPMFCMVLRKHLTGSKIVSISQQGMERILEFAFEGINELGDLVEKRLIIEIMGRHSNIILVDQNRRIIDSIKHITDNISSVRQVLPGLPYVCPPSQDKQDPLTATRESFLGLLNAWNGSGRYDRFLTDTFTGLSKQSSQEILYMAFKGDYSSEGWNSLNHNILADAFLTFYSRVQSGDYAPVLLFDEENRPKDIFPFHYGVYDQGLLRPFDTFSAALDEFYSGRDRADRIKQRTAGMSRVIRANLDRCEKKLAIQRQEIMEAERSMVYKLYGELITANIYNMVTGISEVSVLNYHDPEGGQIIIPLDAGKTPQQNAQNYYRLYNKAKKTMEKQKQMENETLEEIRYLESLAEHLVRAVDEAVIDEIRRELIAGGYVKGTPAKGRSKQQPISKPHHYISSDGYDIYVGKNNLQNDELTLKFASGSDLWLHTKVIPGSHVIVKSKGGGIPERTLLEAARLAAWYSKARQSANVPVDYCPRRNVKKPGGAKPGMVIYEHYNTIYVTPSEKDIDALTKGS